MTTIDSIKELTQVNIAKFGNLVNDDEDVLFIRNDKEIAKVKKNEIARGKFFAAGECFRVFTFRARSCLC